MTSVMTTIITTAITTIVTSAIITGITTVLLPQDLWAQNLNHRQIYERCAAKLMRTTPSASDPLVEQIRNQSLTGVEACKRLLQLAKFDASGLLPAYTGKPAERDMALRVLATLNDVHSSWITIKNFQASNTCISAVTESVFDPQEPALFFTRALFGSGFKYSTVSTSTDNLRAIRTNNDPTESIFDRRIDFIEGFPAGFKMTGNGQLLGVQAGQSVQVKLTASAPNLNSSPAIFPTAQNYEILKNRGGGILGSQAYLLNNFTEDPDLFPNLLQMPRSWGKWVFKDLLCRDLPVLFESDAKPFAVCTDPSKCGIQPTAAQAPHVLPFRQSTSCAQCHVSMDQLIGVARNFRSYRSGKCRFDPNHVWGSMALVQEAPSKPAVTSSWGFVLDPDYHKRPSTGRLIFRSYDGTLVDKEVASLAELGAALANTNDLYVCAAKRYLQYFTGIDVSLHPMSQTAVDNLPPDQKYFRNKVVELGLKFRRTTNGFNQDPIKLIEAIFALPEFAKKDFRLSDLVGGN